MEWLLAFLLVLMVPGLLTYLPSRSNHLGESDGGNGTGRARN
jgi:hypothetical protein